MVSSRVWRIKRILAVSPHGKPVKQARYNLPDVPAGWHVPAPAAKPLVLGTLHTSDRSTLWVYRRAETQLCQPAYLPSKTVRLRR